MAAKRCNWRLLGALAVLPLLAACVNDRAAAEIGNGQVVSLIREQRWPWDESIELSLVVAQMPKCQRRHALTKGTAKTEVELWQYRPDAFIVRVGQNRLYATETYSCEGLARMEAEPADGLGRKLGTFRVKGEVLSFVAEETP